MELLPPGKGDGVREFSHQVPRGAHVKQANVFATTEVYRVVITTNIYSDIKLGINGKVN
jgi:hypothetical protein